ncbi:hypothetical protein GWN42_15545, partial [candidate division KSB1 bacterium]|nr:hypothetical protein [candidate division KSB1 bacterium]NIR71947.1 hypothetical protein [candidate division KSB1 bacterium]NIS24588.1 hypothetical protein [candidate division KSB1 bacterium]NIU25191.1 hypothetical protein [candidate division KSB1 bacterium]NIU93189.1 hypothetical protein [candidate division KSB1 bacterium]
YADQYREAESKTSEYLAMLWVMLLHAFDLNAVWVVTKTHDQWEEVCKFEKDLKKPAPNLGDFHLLMESAYSGGQPYSTQPDELLKDGRVFVEALAAIPIEYDDSRKILVVYKQLTLPESEFKREFVFTSYILRDYMSLVDTYVRVHEQNRKLEQSENLIKFGHVTSDLSQEIDRLVASITKNIGSLRRFIEFERQNQPTDETNERADFLYKECAKSTQPPLELAEQLRSKLTQLQKYVPSNPWEMDYVNINSLIENALTMLRDKLQEANLSKDFNENLQKISCASKRLIQVFINILDNSADAIDREGHIKIRTWQDHKYVYFKVIDDGAGISTENIEKVFKPDFTTKKEGLGIGLYLSRCIVHEHAGTIRVTSEPGKGTALTVGLPIK